MTRSSKSFNLLIQQMPVRKIDLQKGCNNQPNPFFSGKPGPLISKIPEGMWIDFQGPTSLDWVDAADSRPLHDSGGITGL